jgi:hypothetical protein
MVPFNGTFLMTTAAGKVFVKNIDFQCDSNPITQDV